MNNHGLTKQNLLASLPLVLQQDKSMMALADGIAELLSQRPDEIDHLRIYSAIDRLPEQILDILAYDFKVDWWDGNYSLEEKRRTLKGSWQVHKMLGTKAAVETVAENTSDGVIAPLFYIALGGAPLGFFYKAVNTMDSMVGYKNDKYLYFGRAAAKLDDIVNYIPARLSGWIMAAFAFAAGLNSKSALHIFLRDRRCHASPNSAQTEAACAGALQVQLAGDAVYFGKLLHKPTIGDPVRPVEYQDIPRANRLMYVTTVVSLFLFAAAKWMAFLLLTK